MPNEDEDITLMDILDKIKETNKDYNAYVESADERIAEIDDLISEVDELKKDDEQYGGQNISELMKYKSMLIQIKTDIQNEKKNMKQEYSQMDQITGAVEKAIKWNTGDIF